ncbi:50S ribosomal protein L11 [Patescibacteria group bacterium]
MAKKIKTTMKVSLQAGVASPAPPLGPALGQHGVPIMDFVNQYNERTKELKGQVVPAVITIYEDRSFDFILKKAPVADMIKKALKIDKGSGEPNKDFKGELSQDQLAQIAEEKMEDLNADDIEAAKKIVAGTARSMGVKVKS